MCGLQVSPNLRHRPCRASNDLAVESERFRLCVGPRLRTLPSSWIFNRASRYHLKTAATHERGRQGVFTRCVSSAQARGSVSPFVTFVRRPPSSAPVSRPQPPVILLTHPFIRLFHQLRTPHSAFPIPQSAFREGNC